MDVIRRSSTGFFAALLFITSLFGAQVVHARLIFDPADAALTGATSVALDESTGMTFGALTHRIIREGVTFDFATTNSNGLLFDLAPDRALASHFPEGTSIAIDPPVQAIGFLLRYSTIRGVITINGALGSETFETPEGPVDLFIGAADIGDISSVTLNATSVVSLWSHMVFLPSSGGPPPSLNTSDLAITKTGPAGAVSQAVSPIPYDMLVENFGPDTAAGTQVVDFLPAGTTVVGSVPPATLNAPGTIATTNLGDLATGSNDTAHLDVGLPPFIPIPGVSGVFGCEDTLVNVALATSSSIETDPSDNLAVNSHVFDKAAKSGLAEICGNGIDDNCDGLADCGDATCGCLPPLGTATPSQPPDLCTASFPPPAGCPLTVPRERTDACRISNIHGDLVRAPFQWCCDFESRPCLSGSPSPAQCERIPEWQFRSRCGFALDPNFKEADPRVNALGYGYTEAGRTMSYTLQYENIGDADAHDVSIIDVLDDDLDEATLVVNDGGSYDQADRTLRWQDPILPPGTPRSVSFSIDVRADAPSATRIRNVGTIIFPDATPPSRIDTNLVEHVITDPLYPVTENLKVFQCTETAPGSNEWQVDIVNEGFGFGYNVTATIVNPPAPVLVTDPTATFAHPDEVIPPLPNTLTDNGDGTVTQVLDDPTHGDGSALMWLQDPWLALTEGFDADGFMTWDEANAWLVYLNTNDFDGDGLPGYANHTDWRLPRTRPVNGTSYNYNPGFDGNADIGYNITSPNSEMSYLLHVELGNDGEFDTAGNRRPPGSWLPLNTGPFPNFPQIAWSGTEFPLDTTNTWVFSFLDGHQLLFPKSLGLNAWAVRDLPAPDPDAPTTVVPLAYTSSTDTVAFSTETPGDPCGALTWRIQYERPLGTALTVDVQDAPDTDADAVPDATDNCPNTYNPTQHDSDNDAVGDACEVVVCVDDLQARAKSGKIQLTWAHVGSNAYNVYRATVSGGPYVLLASTTSTYSTYLDSTVTNGTTYYYVVRPASNSVEICQSNEVSATPAGRRRR